jgi:ankyrin repeat protein
MKSVFLLLILLVIQSGTKCNSGIVSEEFGDNGSGGTSPLPTASIHECCSGGDLDGLKAYIASCTSKSKKKELVNSKDGNGNTPLHLVASSGQLELVKYLYTCEGIAPNAKNKDKKTALWLAVENGHLEVVKFLVNETAVGKEEKTVKIKFNKDKLIALAKEKEQHDIVQFLSGASGDLKADEPDIPSVSIHDYCSSDKLDDLKAFLQTNPKEVNSKDSNGKTPLHIAASNGYLELVKYLYTCEELKPNSEDKSKKTALYLAVENGHLEVVKFLIANRAMRKGNLIALAKEKRYNDIVQFLSGNSGKADSPSALASDENDGVDTGNDDALHTNNRGSDLGAVSENNHEDVNGGPPSKDEHDDVNGEAVEEPEAASIHQCCLDGKLDGLQACIASCTSKSKKKELVNSKDNNGNTPLHIAASSGHLELVKYLYTCEGIVPNAGGKDKKTALWLAVENEHWEVVKFLIANTAVGKEGKATKTTFNKKELIKIAKAKGQEDIVNLLSSISG